VNIVRISRTFLPIVDGTSIHMYELSKYQEKDNELHLIIPNRKNIPPFSNIHVVDNVDDDKIFYSKFEKLKFHFNLIKKYMYLFKKVDIVHIVGDLHDVIFVVILKLFFNYKIVLSLHGGTTSKKLYKVLSIIFFKFVDKIYMTSNNVSKQLYYISNDKKYITTSGIKFDDISKKNKIDSNFKLISVGRLHEVKAFDDLITSMKYLDDKYTLTIIGNGPEYKYLTDEIIELKLEDRVVLLGEKTRKEIYQLLVQHDIFVLTSVKLQGQEEGTPTAMMEAMGAGLPIISTDTGGVRDLLNEYPSNCIVPQGNPKKLAYAIKYLGEDIKQQEKLSTISLNIAKTKDWSIIAKNITELFQNVLDEK
jgi:glycosyltransferase involved in cell wall biosynthesis